MGNARIQGKVRVSILKPRRDPNIAEEHQPSRVAWNQRWATAVMSVVFDGETVQYIMRVDIAWDDIRAGDAAIELCIQSEWDAHKIRTMVNELADKIYQQCGTTLAAQLDLDNARIVGGERFRGARVRVEWVQREVA